MTETTSQPSASPSGKDLAAEFKKMPVAEKMLAAAAAAMLALWFINGLHHFLFQYSWFPTCCFLGSVLTILLIGSKLFGVRLMDPTLFVKVLILAGILPGIGFVVDQFHDLRGGLMLAAAVVMGYAGAKITTREHVIKMN